MRAKNYNSKTLQILRDILSQVDYIECPPPFIHLLPHRFIFKATCGGKHKVGVWIALHSFWTNNLELFEEISKKYRWLASEVPPSILFSCALYNESYDALIYLKEKMNYIPKKLYNNFLAFCNNCNLDKLNFISSLYGDIILELIVKYDKHCLQVYRNWTPFNPEEDTLGGHAFKIFTYLKMQDDFIKACKDGSLDVVKEVLKDSMQINLNVSRNGMFVLVEACRYGRLEIVKELLKYPYISVNVAKSNSPLTCAIEKNYIEIVELLLSHPKIHVNNGQCSALKMAASRDRIEITKLLLARDDIQVNHPKVSPLAATLNSRFSRATFSTITCLLEYKSIEIGEKELNACLERLYALKKPLLKALVLHPNMKYPGTLKMCSTFQVPQNLYEQIADLSVVDINFVDDCNKTALYTAIEGNVIDKIQFLLKRTDIDIERGDSVLELALQRKYYDVSIQLLKMGADLSRVNVDDVPIDIMDRIRMYLARKKKSARKIL